MLGPEVMESIGIAAAGTVVAVGCMIKKTFSCKKEPHNIEYVQKELYNAEVANIHTALCRLDNSINRLDNKTDQVLEILLKRG